MSPNLATVGPSCQSIWTLGCVLASGCAGSCAQPRTAMPVASTINAISAMPVAMPARDFKKKLTALRLLLFIALPSLQKGMFLVALLPLRAFQIGVFFLGILFWGLWAALLTGIRWMATEFQ